MMEYYQNTLCIPARELVEMGVMSEPNYKQMAARGRFKVARQGKGKGNYALVVVDTLPEPYKEKVEEICPNGDMIRLMGWFESNYERDQAAVAFFFSKKECGVELKPEKANEYVVNASVLNACIRLYDNAKAVQKTMGNTYDWEMMTTAIKAYKERYGHTLPCSALRFRKKVALYKREGYSCLLSGKFGNQNTRLVDLKTERVLLSLAIQPNKPFNTNVHQMYIQFVCGELDVYDMETGELYNPDDFTDKNGEPKILSESTVNNYLNKPKNKVLIEHALSGWSTFMHEQRPHVHRHAPEFSFSKISFDDRDLPRKLKDTKIRPKAYYAYDVTSQCVVGYAHSRGKNVDLVVDMFRSMFRLIDNKGWGCPAQVEVENHLMSQWKESFLKAGVMFPFVRFCAPLNSQEKYAEPLNGAKKKSVEHRNHLGVGRFYGKGKWRTEGTKISDDLNNTYEDKQYFSWEELIADDLADIQEFNNSLHPNQKKYPNMTRWEVLEANMNPTLQPVDKIVLARYIGERVETSIRRNSYCRVNYTDWWLSSTEVLDRLSPNNYNVEAYYIPDEDGNISDVYIYQNGMYIDTLTDVGTFNTADAEQTDEDKAIFVEQQKKISHFDKWVKDNAITRVGTAEKSHSEPSMAEAVELPEAIPDEGTYHAENYALNALEQL